MAQQQLSLALALDCERIICLAHDLRPELIALQHEAERVGAQFHVIGGARALVGLVTAQDEVIVLGDGLFVSRSTAIALLGSDPVVLVQPIEQGLAGGFERLDINHAAAAALRIPGRLVEQIADLPEDCDAVAVLQRIALQAGIRQRPIPPLTDGALFWTLVRNEGEAHAIEPRWIRQRTRDDTPLYPSRALALLAVRRFGPSLLHAGSGAAHMAIGATLLAVMALGAGWLKQPVVGLFLCAIGWLLREVAELLARIETHTRLGWPRLLAQIGPYAVVIDGVIIGLAGWGLSPEPWQSVADRFFPPFMLVALLRILPRTIAARWTAWLGDRMLLAVAIGVALLSGSGNVLIHLGAAIAALVGIALAGLSQRLTRS